MAPDASTGLWLLNTPVDGRGGGGYAEPGGGGGGVPRNDANVALVLRRRMCLRGGTRLHDTPPRAFHCCGLTLGGWGADRNPVHRPGPVTWVTAEGKGGKGK